MNVRTLWLLGAAAATLGVACCDGLANSPHNGPHPLPKSHPPGNKKADTAHHGGTNTDHADHAHGKSSAPVNKNGHSATNPVADAKKHLREREEELRREASRKEKEFRERELLRKLAQLERLMDEGNGHPMRRPYQGMNGQQGMYGPAGFGQQQGFGQNGQGSGQYGQNGQGGAPGDSGSDGGGGAQVAQGSDGQGEAPQHELADGGLREAEKMLMAAIHRLEHLFGREARHLERRDMAEAEHLEQAVRRMEAFVSGFEGHEHPRIEAEPSPNRS